MGSDEGPRGGPDGQAATRRAGGTGRLDGTAAEVRRRAPQLRVEGLWLDGDPATELLSLAEEADEVVVGSRGRGGIAGLVLGSVSQAVLRHATCPVAVAR